MRNNKKEKRSESIEYTAIIGSDFGFDTSTLTSEIIEGLSPEQFSGITIPMIVDMPLDALAGISDSQLSAIPATSMAGLSLEHLVKIPDEAFKGMSADHIKNISASAIAGMNKEKLENLPDEAMAGFNANTFWSIPTEAMSAMTAVKLAILGGSSYRKRAISGPYGQEMDPGASIAGTMETLSPDAFAGATAADLAAMPADAMGGMTADMMGAMPPAAMGGMNAEMMAAMPPDAMGGMSPDMMAAMPPDAMAGMDADMMAAMPPMAMQGMDAESADNLQYDAYPQDFESITSTACQGFDIVNGDITQEVTNTLSLAQCNYVGQNLEISQNNTPEDTEVNLVNFLDTKQLYNFDYGSPGYLDVTFNNIKYSLQVPRKSKTIVNNNNNSRQGAINYFGGRQKGGAIATTFDTLIDNQLYFNFVIQKLNIANVANSINAPLFEAGGVILGTNIYIFDKKIYYIFGRYNDIDQNIESGEHDVPIDFSAYYGIDVNLVLQLQITEDKATTIIMLINNNGEILEEATYIKYISLNGLNIKFAGSNSCAIGKIAGNAPVVSHLSEEHSILGNFGTNINMEALNLSFTTNNIIESLVLQATDLDAAVDSAADGSPSDPFDPMGDSGGEAGGGAPEAPDAIDEPHEPPPDDYPDV